MKKNIIIMFISLVISVLLTSCLTKIDLEKKGSLNLTIKWPKLSTETQANSRAIKVGTTTIVVTIHQQGKPETTQTRTITHSNEAYHSVEFTDLTEGKWHLSIVGKDISGETISEYVELIDITEDAPTIVQTKFGAPKKIEYVNPNSSPSIIQDGAVMTTEFGELSAFYQGNTYNDNTIPLTEVRIQVSEDSDFETEINNSPYIISDSMSLGYIEDLMSPISIGVGFIDSYFNLEPSTKYYWRIIVTNEYGSTTSKVFSFTTRTKYIPNQVTSVASSSVPNGATNVLTGNLLAINDPGTSPSSTMTNSCYFYISTSTDFSSPDIQTSTTFIDGVASIPVTVGVGTGLLQGNTLYYWKVIVSNSDGSTSSNIFSFTTGLLPN